MNCLNHPTRVASPIACLTLLLAASAAVASNGTEIFRDDFSTFSTANWTVANWSTPQGRTNWGYSPTTAAGVATFKLDTYNATSPGVTVKSTEIVSKTAFTPSTGLEFEARVRTNSTTPGLVTAFFTYGTHNDATHGTVNDEIDFEFLSKENNPTPAGGDSLWGVSYNDYYSGSVDPNMKASGHPQLAGFDTNAFNTFKIRLFPDRTEWWVNGTRVQTLSQAVPNDPMNVELSIWAPDSSWTSAYSSALMPSATAAGNVSHTYDVDYVSVRRLANQWTSNISGTWSDDANWSGSNPSAVGAVANFLDAPAGVVTVILASGRIVGTLNLDSSNSYTFNGTSAIIYDVASGTAALNVTQGSHNIIAPTKLNDDLAVNVASGATLYLAGTIDNSLGKAITIAGGGTVNISGTRQTHAPGSSLTTSAGLTNFYSDLGGTMPTQTLNVTIAGPSVAHADQHVATLTLAAGGTLDLLNHDLFTTTPAATIRQYLFANQLTSTAADPNDVLSLGYGAATNGTTLVTLTYTGDANLDGRINPDDYAALDRGFLKHLATWQDGDFNYDGVIDAKDYALIDRVFVKQGVPLSPDFLSSREAQFGGEYVSQLLAAVPEPGIGLFSVIALTAVRRRRN